MSDPGGDIDKGARPCAFPLRGSLWVFVEVLKDRAPFSTSAKGQTEFIIPRNAMNNYLRPIIIIDTLVGVCLPFLKLIATVLFDISALKFFSPLSSIYFQPKMSRTLTPQGFQISHKVAPRGAHLLRGQFPCFRGLFDLINRLNFPVRLTHPPSPLPHRQGKAKFVLRFVLRRIFPERKSFVTSCAFFQLGSPCCN